MSWFHGLSDGKTWQPPIEATWPGGGVGVGPGVAVGAGVAVGPTTIPGGPEPGLEPGAPAPPQAVRAKQTRAQRQMLTL